MIEENIGREDGITIELIRLQGIIDSGIDQKIHPKVWHAIEELMSLKKLEFINDCKRRLSSCSQIDALFPFAGQTYRNDIIGMFNKLGKEVSDSLKYAIDNSNVIKYYSIEEFNLSYEREKLRKYLKEQFGEKSIIPDDILNLVIEKDRESRKTSLLL
jgi:hypothetical protein